MMIIKNRLFWDYLRVCNAKSSIQDLFILKPVKISILDIFYESSSLVSLNNFKYFF